jgi:signal transduction histidine kinase
MKSFFIAILALLGSSICSAQQIIRLEAGGYRNLGKEIGFWEDSSRNLPFEKIELLSDTLFRPAQEEIFNGKTDNKIWWSLIRFTGTPDIAPYLIIDYPNLDSIDIYYRDTADKIRHIRSGSSAPLNSRAFASSEYIFKLETGRDSVQEIYIRFSSLNSMVIPIKLVDGDTLVRHIARKYLLKFLYIGITISLLLFNLFMYLSTADRSYMLYIGRILFLFYGFVVAYMEGAGHFLGDSGKNFITQYAYVLAAVGFICTILFNNSFLKVKNHLPRAVPLFNVLIILWIINIVLSLSGYRIPANKLMQVLVFITSLAMLAVSIRIINIVGYRKKYPLITFYIIGWIPISLAIFYFVPAIMGFFPLRDYSFSILFFAAVTEGVFISLALLGDRIWLLRDQKRQAEEKNLELIKERNAYLEEKIHEHTKELKAAVQELKSSNTIKDKLFSIIAHDLRSPIYNLSTMLQFSDNNQVDPEDMRQLLKGIRKDTENVQNTLDNLLNWALTQMKMSLYNPEYIVISSFLQRHLSMYQALIQKKNILSNIFCEEDIRILADKNQLSLIIRNLIDNAVKFTPPQGTIEIGAKKEGSAAIIYVANSGKELSAETIGRILDTEEVGSSFGTANEKGTGLGLQLCKEFIRNMGSQLKIERREEGMTIFSFEIQVQDWPETTP